MSKEEGFIAKWYGIYDQRQAGNFMARIMLRPRYVTGKKFLDDSLIDQLEQLPLETGTTQQLIKKIRQSLAEMGSDPS